VVTIVTVLATIGIATALAIVCAARRRLRHTTLAPAWRWCCAATVAWVALWTADGVLGLLAADFAGILWCGVALVALCGPIAVLGAKRPGARVWNWFVLVPLLAVLGWPVLTVWRGGTDVRPLVVEAPQLAAFVLVLLMGCGNYVGTRYGVAAFLAAAALCLLVVPLCRAGADAPILPDDSRLWATLCLAAAVWWAALRSRGSRSTGTGCDRLWLDFRDTFGIVWGQRIEDRINERAVQEHWAARLHARGFVWDPAADPEARAHTARRIEHTLRWLLRRFVDDEWINARLGLAATGGSVPPARRSPLARG
jgi:hypothetical protein